MKLALAVLALMAATPAIAETSGAMPGMNMSAAPAAGTADGIGQIKSIDAKAGSITIHHGPIAALGWPAMTMTFKASPEVLRIAKAGQTIKFVLQTSDNRVLAIQPQ